MSKKKIVLNMGDLVKIDLGNGMLCFGRVLEEPLLAFYDLSVVSEPNLKEVVSSPILFKICVMNHAITSGRWPIIGSLSLDEGLKKPVKFFKQDPISKELCIYINAEEIPATLAECDGLERAAVWDPEHVEDRLRDHYAGVPNQWVESLKIK